jgi:two-component system sensor histidine kinase AlgZ
MNRTTAGSRRYWMRMTTGNVAAAVVVAITFGGVTWHTPWRETIESFAVSLVFSFCIGPMLATVMPRLGPIVFTRLRFPLNWAAMIAVMTAIATAGSFAALVLLAAVGYLQPGRILISWFGGSLKISIIVALTFGILITAYEVMRAQLDAATLALRTKERDEAEIRRIAAEAQLASLESRVQPHFLFNALNSIAALVHEDPTGAERMTTQLASLMRSSLDGQSATLVPLEDELRVVRDYLEIERVRFGDRLRYRIDADGVAATILVPRLSLQTLVENSVKYAVSSRREGGAIVVTVKDGGGNIHLRVEDDGPGFDARAIPANHGLALLTARLAMVFDGRATLQIDSTPRGTTIDMRVPRERVQQAVPSGRTPV